MILNRHIKCAKILRHFSLDDIIYLCRQSIIISSIMELLRIFSSSFNICKPHSQVAWRIRMQQGRVNRLN